MISQVLDGLSWILFLSGGFFIVVGAVGTLRFPDFYTRLHAAGVTDTLGADLMLLAMMLQADNWLLVVKLLFVFAFIMLTSPVSTHAIAHAAWVRRLNPMVGEDLHYAESDEECGRPAKTTAEASQ